MWTFLECGWLHFLIWWWKLLGWGVERYLGILDTVELVLDRFEIVRVWKRIREGKRFDEAEKKRLTCIHVWGISMGDPRCNLCHEYKGWNNYGNLWDDARVDPPNHPPPQVNQAGNGVNIVWADVTGINLD